MLLTPLFPDAPFIPRRYLAHETWYDRTGLWSQKGLKHLKKLTFPASDQFVIDLKLEELELLARQLEKVS